MLPDSLDELLVWRARLERRQAIGRGDGRDSAAGTVAKRLAQVNARIEQLAPAAASTRSGSHLPGLGVVDGTAGVTAREPAGGGLSSGGMSAGGTPPAPPRPKWGITI